MLRRSLLLLPFVVAAGCAPGYEAAVSWTIEGEDPAPTCTTLPDGAVIQMTIESRDSADEHADTETTTTTTTTTDCGRGTLTVPVGRFSHILVELTDGSDVLGVAAPVSTALAAPSSGDSLSHAPVVADVRIVRGRLKANLTVGGRDCETAGASSFQVSLFENSEPRTSTPVVENVDVACTRGTATFEWSPVTVGATYFVHATTTTDGGTFATPESGEGVVAKGANTVLDVALLAQ